MHYEGTDVVRNMLDDQSIDQEVIDTEATKLGWPQKDVRPYHVALQVEKKK